jgi:hypothetical protein
MRNIKKTMFLGDMSVRFSQEFFRHQLTDTGYWLVDTGKTISS